MTDSFWDGYRALVGRLFDPLEEGDGVPEQEIARAEARLGLRLPRLLREFYRHAGGRDDINGSQDMLIAPDNLEVVGGMLIFYDENQGVVHWGIAVEDASLDDPPILVAESTDWERAHDRLSEFLVAMTFWQAVSGGMRVCGHGEARRGDLDAVPPGWERVDLGGHSGWRAHALLGNGQVLFVDDGGDDQGPDARISVQAGARTQEALHAMGAALRVSWSDWEDQEDEGPLEPDPAEVARRREEQQEKAQTPWGDAVCAGCGALKRVWANTARGRCGRCGHPLITEP